MPQAANTLIGTETSYLSADSAVVSKAEFKRFNRIFTRPSGRHDLDEVEVHNAYVLMKNKKGFSDREIKAMAVNRGKATGKVQP
jgi:hypothetical protein